MPEFVGNRVVRDTGSRYPIFNAPIGYFARSGIAGGVTAAGGTGLFETASTSIKDTAAELETIRASTDGPIGLHLFLSALKPHDRLDKVLDWAVGETHLVVSCAGNPNPITKRVHEAGALHYHQIGTLEEALKAVDGGADGLIVEGAESGGLRGVKALHIFSLLQQVRSRVDVPLVAAGGIVDGFGMAGAFGLGAEGVVMGTRFMSSAESPVHQNWKDAVAAADATLSLDIGLPGMRMRVVRNELSEAVARGEIDANGNPYAGPFLEAFRNGRLDIAMVGAGETASLIYEIKPIAEIVDETITVFWQEIRRLARMLPPDKLSER